MDIVEFTQSFQAVLGGLQALTSLTNKAKQHGASDEFTRDLNTAVINMQGAVLDAQSMTLEAQNAQSRLLSEINKLKDQVKRADDWAKEKARYELIKRDNSQVYKLREGSREDDPMHYSCPVCYEEGMKSILQQFWGIPDSRCLKCQVTF